MPLDASTAITVHGVQCWDEGSGASLSNKQGQSSAWWKVRCNWADQYTLVSSLLGGVRLINGVYVFQLPEAYGAWGALLAQKADIKGEGILSGGPPVAYQWAVITFTFAPPDWKVGDPKAIGEDELETSTEGVCLSGDSPSFQWEDGTPIFGGMTPVFEYTTVTFNKTRHFVPTLNEPLILSLIDCSNSTSFFGADPETIRFKGSRSQRTIFAANTAVSGNQNTGWTLTHTFLFNRNGVNKLPRPSAGVAPTAAGASSWVGIKDMAGNKPYPPKDLNQLFQ